MDDTEENFAAIVTKPGSIRSNKTGSWRTLKPKVLFEKCIGCGTCERFCPEGCIKIIDKKSTIDYDYCKGCGICAIECPVKAIIMEKEDKDCGNVCPIEPKKKNSEGKKAK
jgi:pyruvate ferredoxin oxidoreductase delta subunit